MTAVKTIPFDPTLFVNREREKTLFFDTVRAGTKRAYLEFTGVAGQGKSELLKWIYHNAEEEGYLSAYIDFEYPQYHRPEIYPILETIVEHLSSKFKNKAFQEFQAQLPIYQDQLRTFYRDTLENPKTADRRRLQDIENQLIATFNRELYKSLEVYKIVLCLDSTEKAYPIALRSFEDQILAQHTHNPYFFLVTAGQEKLIWKSTEIRTLIKRYELPVLDYQGVQEQITRLAQKKGFPFQDAEQISDKILQLTLGHPFSNYKLVDFWTDGFDRSLDKEVVAHRFGKGIRNLVSSIIEDRILENLEHGSKYPPAREILWYLAPLRRIEFGTLWYMLSTFLGKWFKDQPFEFFEQLMDKFQKKRIFRPWQLGIGYDLEPIVRNILLWDMRVNAKREDYIFIEQTLADQYDQWVQQSRDATQIKNIVEQFYHSASYLHETNPGKMNLLLQEKLENYLQRYFTKDFLSGDVALREQCERLSNELKRDRELAELVDISSLQRIIKHSID
ncbi:MAG: hypothetical protein RBT80_17585 [Candidatus Vecturithrix sp.]|jgi:hypothetical protein|nr:hypothetical protein [Candidatus Vecturithrix sp.]